MGYTSCFLGSHLQFLLTVQSELGILAIKRIQVNQQGIGNKHWKVYQLKEALLGDPMPWAFFFYALIADIPNGMI